MATPRGEAQRLLNAPEKDRDEIIGQQLSHADVNGSIMTHLAANKDTRPLVAAYVGSHFDGAWRKLNALSDPEMTARGWLAAECAALRPQIVERVLGSADTRGLAVLSRMAARNTWDGVDIVKVAQWAVQWAPGDGQAGVVLVSLWQKPGVAAAVEKYIISQRAYGPAGLVAALDPDGAGLRLLNAPFLAEESAPVMAVLYVLNALCASRDARLKVVQKYKETIETGLQDEETVVIASAVRTKLVAGGAVPELKGSDAAAEMDRLSRTFEAYVERVSTEPIKKRKNRNSSNPPPLQRRGSTASMMSTVSVASTSSLVSTMAPVTDLPWLGTAVEGLAATSLLPSVRKRAVGIIPQLVALVRGGGDAAQVYASLVVLVNTVEYPMRDTHEQRRLKELAHRAQGGPGVFESQPPPSAEEVSVAVDAVLNSRLIPWLSQNTPKLSLSSRVQVATLLRNMACQQGGQRRLSLATQGLVVTALYLWACKDTGRTLSERDKSVAAAAVAKTLVSVPPKLAFTDKFPAIAVVDPLRDQIASSVSVRPNLDTMEAIMALTNVCSMGDAKLTTVVARRCFGKLQTIALSTDYVPIQRACLELMCNLMTVAAGAEAFLQRTAQSTALLDLLGSCLVVADRDSRLAAAGALAMLSEWETAPEYVGHNVQVVNGLISSLPDDNTADIDYDMLVRVLTAIITLVQGSLHDHDDEVAESVIHYGGLARLDSMIDYVDTKVLGGAPRRLLFNLIQLLAQFRVNPDDAETLTSTVI